MYVPIETRLRSPSKTQVRDQIILRKAVKHQILRAMLLESASPNIFGIIAQNGSSAAIAFRGTETPEQWPKDFDFIHVPLVASGI